MKITEQFIDKQAKTPAIKINEIMLNLKSVLEKLIKNTSLFALNIKSSDEFPLCVITDKSDSISANAGQYFHIIDLDISVFDSSYTKCNELVFNILQMLKSAELGAMIKGIKSIEREHIELTNKEAFKMSIKCELKYSTEHFAI
ncbi:hypothetical protein [Campylobacter sp. RM12637]|uniref:hypothetical protein n=1 Tax=Campylobacter sp. RM12637 TaxID=2735734 RepID=UPI0030150FF4|nr:hypothetical protein [Campylobacter sp. RM12637]